MSACLGRVVQGGWLIGVGGPVISQLLFLFHVVPVSLFSFNLNGPSRFIRPGTRRLQCIVVQGSTSSTELASTFRIPISALPSLPTPGTKFSGQRHGRTTVGNTTASDSRVTQERHRPGAQSCGTVHCPSCPLITHQPAIRDADRSPRRRRRRDDDEDERRVGDTDSQLSNQTRARHRA